MDPKPEDLAEYFRTRKIAFDRCLEPTMQCGEPTIRAHSIQNRQTIELLQRDNHLIAWQPRLLSSALTLRSDGSDQAMLPHSRDSAISTIRSFSGRTTPSRSMARIERGVESPDSSSPAGQNAVEQMLKSWATWRYRPSYYNEPLLLQTAPPLKCRSQGPRGSANLR